MFDVTEWEGPGMPFGDVTKFRAKSSERQENTRVLGWVLLVINLFGLFSVSFVLFENTGYFWVTSFSKSASRSLNLKKRLIVTYN